MLQDSSYFRNYNAHRFDLNYLCMTKQGTGKPYLVCDVYSSIEERLSDFSVFN